jgi:hypothetical protein
VTLDSPLWIRVKNKQQREHSHQNGTPTDDWLLEGPTFLSFRTKWYKRPSCEYLNCASHEGFAQRDTMMVPMHTDINRYCSYPLPAQLGQYR